MEKEKKRETCVVSLFCFHGETMEKEKKRQETCLYRQPYTWSVPMRDEMKRDQEVKFWLAQFEHFIVIELAQLLREILNEPAILLTEATATISGVSKKHTIFPIEPLNSVLLVRKTVIKWAYKKKRCAHLETPTISKCLTKSLSKRVGSLRTSRLLEALVAKWEKQCPLWFPFKGKF